MRRNIKEGTLTEDRHGARGFTFFEVLVTLAVLSTGIVMIYKGLILSLNYQQHLTNRLFARHLLDDKVAQIEKYYEETGEIPQALSGETRVVTLNNRDVRFYFSTTYQGLGEFENIYRVRLSLRWRERDRDMRLAQTTIIYDPTPEEDEKKK